MLMLFFIRLVTQAFNFSATSSSTNWGAPRVHSSLNYFNENKTFLKLDNTNYVLHVSYNSGGGGGRSIEKHGCRHAMYTCNSLCPLSLVSTIAELLGRKSSGSSLENREYGRRDPSRWQRNTLYLYPQKLTLTSPTSGGCSAGIVRSRTQATEFSCNSLCLLHLLGHAVAYLVEDYASTRKVVCLHPNEGIFNWPNLPASIWLCGRLSL
jgi:hypothetical protein